MNAEHGIVSTHAHSRSPAIPQRTTETFAFHLSVAATVGKGIVDQGIVDQYVVFGALIGAIAWNLITWWYGIPSSSSHALIGGLVGATVAKAGTGALIAPGLLKTIAFIFVAPVLGMVFGVGAHRGGTKVDTRTIYRERR